MWNIDKLVPIKIKKIKFNKKNYKNNLIDSFISKLNNLMWNKLLKI